MNKLSRKFIFGITVILLCTMAASLLLNSNLTSRYYLYEKKKELDGVCDRLEQSVRNGEGEQAIAALEESEDVTIVSLSNRENLDQLNEQLRDSLSAKGIGFQKFWLWEGDYEKLEESGRKISIYNQGKLNYSLLVEYMEIGTELYVVATIIPHAADAISIINTVTTGIMALSMLVTIVLMAALFKRITRPLDLMKRQADDIAMRKFHPVVVDSRDELGTVAASMNQMCVEIQNYQNELLDKNIQMEELLDGVAHDLKTPIALVKAYASGIKDGMDDGTFLDTIIRQNDRMGAMVESLLYLSRMKRRELDVHQVSLDTELRQLLEEQSILAERDDIDIQSEICDSATIRSNQELVALILSNLLSNALKYSSGKEIKVLLAAAQNGYLFEIVNETEAKLNLPQIWEPFYVGEESRNKDLSGTGLGLALVKHSAEQIGCTIECSMDAGKIIFRVLFQDIEA